jgi:hypothetical protein
MHQSKEKVQQAQSEHKSREEMFEQIKEQKGKRRTKIIAGCGVFVLVLAAYATYAMVSPGPYDQFAKCLTTKGAVMYGEDWCPYTNAQKGMFGKSFKYINYQVKSDLNLRPTWTFDGKSYETVQAFERLAELTGCEI